MRVKLEEEFAKNVIKASLIDYKSRSSDNYVFNDEKCDKMNDVIAYCHELENKFGCKIIRCMLEPKHEQGYIQVLFSGELAFGNTDATLKAFIDTLKLCDGINISTNPAGEDLFQITFFIEDLWIKKQ